MLTEAARLQAKFATPVARKTTSAAVRIAATASKEAHPREEVAKVEVKEEEEIKDKAVANRAKTRNSPDLLNLQAKSCFERKARRGSRKDKR